MYLYFKIGKGCPGKALYDIKNNEFRVYKECNFDINHEKCTFEKFEINYNNNDLTKIDINLKIYQRFFFRYLFKNKIATDKLDAIDKFKLKFGNDLTIKLSDNDINFEKSKMTSDIKDDNLLNLISCIKKEIKNLIIKKTDISYYIKYYNKHQKIYKNIKKEEEIIYFGTKEMFENLNNNNITQYFLDVTYQIIPYKFKPYKLFTIKGFDNNNKFTKLCCLILIKYEDTKSFYFTIKYLNDFFLFNPKIINIDYSMALYNALSNKKLFDNQCKIIQCFFHFTQSLIRKMKKLNIIKKKLNKESFEILMNIQIVCFVNPIYIDKYLKFLKNKLKNNKEHKLYEYLNSYWVNNRGLKTFNYYEIINKQNNDNTIDYLFITNNIIESFHAKISKYLPKGPKTSKSFFISITNILKDSVLTKNVIKRHDYNTKTLIAICKSYNEQKDKVNYKWFTYSEFYEIEKNLIKKDKNQYSEEEINNEIEIINDVDEIENIENLLNSERIDEDFEKDLNSQEESENEEEINFNNNIEEIFDDTSNYNINNFEIDGSKQDNSQYELKNQNNNSINLNTYIKNKKDINKNINDNDLLNNLFSDNISEEQDNISNILDETKSKEKKINKIKYPKPKKRVYNEIKKSEEMDSFKNLFKPKFKYD